MARGNPAQKNKIVPCLAGAITASANGKSIDRLGWNELAFVYQFGTTTTGTSGTVTLSLEDSADDSSFTAISGAATSALSTDSGGQNAKRVCIRLLNLDGVRRYVRAVITIAGTASTGATGPQNNAGALILGDPAVTLDNTAFDTMVSV